jgi:hypothetical protein
MTNLIPQTGYGNEILIITILQQNIKIFCE